MLPPFSEAGEQAPASVVLGYTFNQLRLGLPGCLSSADPILEDTRSRFPPIVGRIHPFQCVTAGSNISQ